VVAARLAAAPTQFGRQVVPADSRLQHKPNATVDATRIQGLSTEIPPPTPPRCGIKGRKQSHRASWTITFVLIISSPE
jgi:hypothetical protein